MLPAMEPLVPLLPICSVPPLMVVPPLWVFAPESVSLPVPVLVNDPVSLITPLNSVLELSPPAVSAPEPSVIWPAPAMDPTVSLKSFRSYVPSLSIVTTVLSESALFTPACRAPVSILVVPV